MTKSEKIHNYQTALNCLTHSQNIIKNAMTCFERHSARTFDYLAKAQGNVYAARDSLIEDFINDSFTDCVSDCATVPAIVPATATAPTVPATEPVRVIQANFGIPLFLTKGDEKIPFRSYSAAGRFLADKFSKQDHCQAANYSIHVSNYLKNPRTANLALLHGYIPSTSADLSQISTTIANAQPVTLTKEDFSQSFDSQTQAANFLFAKFGKQDVRSIRAYATAISAYIRSQGIMNYPILHGYIPSLPNN